MNQVISPESIDLSVLPSLAITDRKQFPAIPCVYFAIDSQGVVQYIGQTSCLSSRWANHHRFDQLESLGDVCIAYQIHIPNTEDALRSEEVWFDADQLEVLPYWGKSHEHH